MKRFQKILFFLILTSMIFSFAYLFVAESAPAFGGGDNCRYGWNGWPGNPCHWDHATNCVECTPQD